MKKFLTVILTLLTLSLSLLCLFGCSANVDGKYILANAVGQSGNGMTTFLDETNDKGEYVNINQGLFLSENFWIEIQGKTMTIHGSISPVVAETNVKFNVNSENVRTINHFTLKTNTTNKNWYAIYDERGEDTSYIILKSGDSLVFKFGNPGDSFWYNISYNKA